MSDQETVRSLPKFCADCGEPLTEPVPVPQCLGCMDQDTVGALVAAYHRQGLALLRGKDRARAIAVLKLARDQADADLQAARELLPGLETAARDAITAERDAQDRARDAAQYAAECAEADRRAERDKASPAERTDARKTAEAAAAIAQGERAACEGASAVARGAETALAAARRRESALEDAAVAARSAAEHPPATVPMSEWTAATAHPLLALAQPGITKTEKTLVSIQVQAEANLCGLSAIQVQQGHEAGRKEAEEAAAHRPVIIPAGDGSSAMTITPLRAR